MCSSHTHIPWLTICRACGPRSRFCQLSPDESRLPISRKFLVVSMVDFWTISTQEIRVTASNSGQSVLHVLIRKYTGDRLIICHTVMMAVFRPITGFQFTTVRLLFPLEFLTWDSLQRLERSAANGAWALSFSLEPHIFLSCCTSR